MKLPHMFIHIPKTAGTSFRLGAEQYFSSSAIAKDYGQKSQETTQLVLDHIYKNNDVFGFNQSLLKNNIKFLTGHYHISKYLPVFHAAMITTFMREPVQRVISEYKHLVKNNNLQVSLQEFYRTQNQINKQRKQFRGIPIEAIGFIGITERYQQSLEMINKKYDIEIPLLFRNLGKKNVRDNHEVPKETLKEIQRLNHADLTLYDSACQIFEKRWDFFSKNLPYTMGRIAGVANNNVLGWASYEHSIDPVKIDVLVEEKSKGTATAVDYRPHLRQIGMNRSGCIGYTFPLGNVKQGDKIRCIVTETGQELQNSPFTVS
ncbi:MAG: sulfotransferase family 2 domain-containing protein [Desulfobacterales bacterium]|nr:sulfotransferase family 2 domain-containing protein [Desulfobacterales bacterium]